MTTTVAPAKSFIEGRSAGVSGHPERSSRDSKLTGGQIPDAPLRRRSGWDMEIVL